MTINNTDAIRPKNVRVELANAIYWDNGKGKREKKEHRGSGIGVGDNKDALSFAVG